MINPIVHHYKITIQSNVAHWPQASTAVVVLRLALHGEPAPAWCQNVRCTARVAEMMTWDFSYFDPTWLFKVINGIYSDL